MQHGPRHLAVVVQQTPVGLSYIASLGTHPAQVTAVAAVVPNQAFGLQLSDHLVGLRPLIISGAVNLTRLVGTTIPAVATIGSVEPHLEDVPIVRQ